MYFLSFLFFFSSTWNLLAMQVNEKVTPGKIYMNKSGITVLVSHECYMDSLTLSHSQCCVSSSCPVNLRIQPAIPMFKCATITHISCKHFASMVYLDWITAYCSNLISYCSIWWRYVAFLWQFHLNDGIQSQNILGGCVHIFISISRQELSRKDNSQDKIQQAILKILVDSN